jgi:purine-binding chemotaxis protein CheW
MKDNNALPATIHASAFMPQGLYAQQILNARASLLAEKIAVIDEQKEMINFIRFRLAGNQYFGILFANAKEVLMDAKLTVLPLAPPFVGGVMNYRGKFIPVIDLTKLFALPAANPAAMRHVIVIEMAGIKAAILADFIESSVNGDANQLAAPLTTRNSIKPNYVKGLYQGTTALLNIENIFQDCQIEIKKYSPRKHAV